MSIKDSAKSLHGIGSLKMFPPPARCTTSASGGQIIVGRVSTNAPLGSFGERSLHYDGRRCEIATVALLNKSCAGIRSAYL